MRLGLSESDVKLVGGQVNELLIEIQNTIRLLEADKIPANPEDHERLEQNLAKDIRSYFRDLSDTLPWSDLEMLYYKLVKQE